MVLNWAELLDKQEKRVLRWDKNEQWHRVHARNTILFCTEALNL